MRMKNLSDTYMSNEQHNHGSMHHSLREYRGELGRIQGKPPLLNALLMSPLETAPTGGKVAIVGLSVS